MRPSHQLLRCRGGTVIQDWSSAEAMAACEPPNQGDGGVESGVESGVSTHLFNAMIAPLLNTTIAGAIWCPPSLPPAAPPHTTTHLPPAARRRLHTVSAAIC